MEKVFDCWLVVLLFLQAGPSCRSKRYKDVISDSNHIRIPRCKFIAGCGSDHQHPGAAQEPLLYQQEDGTQECAPRAGEHVVVGRVSALLLWGCYQRQNAPCKQHRVHYLFPQGMVLPKFLELFTVTQDLGGQEGWPGPA